MKRQPSEWEKIFANKATDKGFISKIFKRAHTAQYQKDKQPNQKMGRKKKKWAEDLHRYFSKEDIQMA